MVTRPIPCRDCGAPVATDPDGLPYAFCPEHLPIVASAYDEEQQ
ncbi:hypothetical protein [Pseudonocardia parietis]|uniref:Uncharacterized protein n=1 Tax=Pseudonocardia parietis TaxID=570936 RepID=A0ABS4W226_9PSEU|nr:hypothetical protein [Pseudonocardia parietis]MBP2370257.1 hypothetical protein [Pseudonocardia parietis]